MSIIFLTPPVLFLLTSLSGHALYAMFGLIAVFVILWVFVSGQLGCFTVFRQIKNGDPAWAWMVFLTGGAPGVAVFCVGLAFFFFRTRIVGYVSQGLFVGFVGVLSLALFLMEGAIHYIPAYRFVVARSSVVAQVME